MCSVLLPCTNRSSALRNLTEEFASLLDQDFVDVVFKVRGTHELFAAHRCLVAAACKHLREDLRRIQSPPASEVRAAGLAWVAKAPPAPSTPGSLAGQDGILDASKEMWGDANITKALLSFLYGKPTEVSERTAILLRETGKNLGFGELVESCEEALAALKAVAQDDSVSARPRQDPGAVKMDRSSSTGGMCAVSGLVRSTSSDRFLNRNLSGERKEGEGNEVTRSMSGTDMSYAVQMKSNPTAIQRSESSGEGRNFAKNRKGSTSPHRPAEANAAEKPAMNPSTDHGVVRRVLSEIRRSMAESSRIIADKTFQQIYELVPGTRGILGEGINGQVRLAIERNTGREVAVKRISCVNLSEQRRQMLVSEVGIFLQVHHQNVVKLLEVYESEVDQAVLLVMELCTGKELFERLAERKWYSEYDAARVTRQMLDAVAYLHSQNICHRDLKLENWLYENPKAEAKLKLCDFGFGQIVQPSVQLTATIGSLYYVAPEVLEGSYGIPCDMWSMGVIVYMLLSGKPPFDGKEDADVVAKIRQGRFICNDKRWEGISETAKHFIRSLLRKDPYERLSAAEAAQHAWLKMDQAAKSSWPQGTPDSELELPINRCVIRDMWKFAQNNAITRAALGIFGKLSSSSSFGVREEDIALLEQRFKSFDEQSSGKISAETFIKVLKESLQVQLSINEEKEFFDRIADVIPPADEEEGKPEDSSAKLCERWTREVNYKEFIMITKTQRRAITTAAIREAFRAFDENGDGYIKEDDAHSLLGQEFKDTISSYVNKLGKDVIEYRDFAKLVTLEMASKGEQEPPPPGVGEEIKSDVQPAEVPEAEAPEILANGTADLDPTAPILAREVSPAQSAGKRIDADAREVPEKGVDSERLGSHETAEECDADAQSDEEQLVNVEETSENDPIRTQDMESAKEILKTKEPGTSQRWTNSFSLSLAGSSEYDDSWNGVNRVISRPSDVYYIKQLPGFHKKVLRPFYAARPVSNVVMGLIRGTSLYARQSVVSKIATIIHTKCGSFFIMPNPKYHTEVDARKGLLSKDAGKFRFVAWWIHPGFVQTIKHWFQKLESEDRRSYASRLQGDEGPQGAITGTAPAGRGSGDFTAGTVERTEKSNPTIGAGILNTDGSTLNGLNDEVTALKGGEEFMGSPGDFRFSDVPKPENYLHTYRDLHTKDHVIMIQQLMEGTMRFLRSLFDESFIKNWELNAGFHYPVRTQYATLHMHVRVNSGPFCREDGRGMDAQKLMETLRADRTVFERDDQTLKYQVTENAKVCLLAAAQEYEALNDGPHPCHQISPTMFELGHHAMPTIHDDDEEDDDQAVKDRSESPGLPDFQKIFPSHVFDANIQLSQLDDASNQYLVNLQPALGSAFYQVLYKLRKQCREKFGPDPTHLYPLHVSVTGFFEASGSHLRQLVTGMTELLQQELATDDSIEVRKVVCTETGYVLFDTHAPAISRFSEKLHAWAQQELGLCIRPKAVNHISLASNRPDKESRENVRRIFEPEHEQGEGGLDIAGAIKTATFDLVFSRLLQRGSFETLNEEGPHRFMEVARIPVTSRSGVKPTPAVSPMSSP